MIASSGVSSDHRSKAHASVACIILLAIGCGGETSPSGPKTPLSAIVVSVSVAPAEVTLPLETGATTQLTATVAGSGGATLTGRTVAWSSSDPTRASVSNIGIVTPVATGVATITATVDGKSGTAAVTVIPQPVSAVLISPGSITVPLGLAAQLAATVYNQAGAPVSGQTIAWASSDTATARVDANGLLVTGRTGTATITASTGAFSGQANVTVSTAPPIASCKLSNRQGTVAFGFPRAAVRLKTTGTVRATVLFVDFSDAPATRTPQNVLDILQPTAPNFFAALSYGAMNMVLAPNLRWFRMSKPSTQYGWPSSVTYQAHLALLQEAADLAAATTDYLQTDLLVVVTNPDAGGISNGPALIPNAGGGIRVPGRTTTIDNATNSGRDLLGWGGTWLNHEVGHLMSLPDLYDYSPPQVGGRLHVGDWSQMGQINGKGSEWSAFERWQLGWIRDDQMMCAPSGTSLASLSPIETAGGYKAVLLPLSATLAVVVESRRALGYDSAIPQPGPLVYFIDTNVASGRGTMRVLPVEDADQVKLARTLLAGQTITYQGASVTLVSRTDGSDVVRVVRP